LLSTLFYFYTFHYLFTMGLVCHLFLQLFTFWCICNWGKFKHFFWIQTGLATWFSGQGETFFGLLEANLLKAITASVLSSPSNIGGNSDWWGDQSLGSKVERLRADVGFMGRGS